MCGFFTMAWARIIINYPVWIVVRSCVEWERLERKTTWLLNNLSLAWHYIGVYSRTYVFLMATFRRRWVSLMPKTRYRINCGHHFGTHYRHHLLFHHPRQRGKILDFGGVLDNPKRGGGSNDDG